MYRYTWNKGCFGDFIENSGRPSCGGVGSTLQACLLPFCHAKAKGKICVNALQLMVDGNNSNRMSIGADWHIYGIAAFQMQLWSGSIIDPAPCSALSSLSARASGLPTYEYSLICARGTPAHQGGRASLAGRW